MNAGWVELNATLKEMRRLWEDTREVWSDAVRQDFEENRWAPLESQTVATLRAMDRLSPVLTQARRECE